MKKLHYISFVIALLFSQNVLSQQNFWRTASAKKNVTNEDLVKRAHTPTKSIKLDFLYDNFVNYLTNTSQKNSETLIKFPNNKGEFSNYRIVENSSLSPELQQKYPSIKSYVGYNVDHPSEIINFSFSPQFGLYGSITSEEKTTLIDPYQKDKLSYIIYDKNDLVKSKDYTCLLDVTESGLGVDNLKLDHVKSARNQANDGKLLKFRLAVTTTTEYSNYVIQQANVTNGTETEKKAAIFAAVNISVSRINGILKNDLGVVLELIPTTDQLFFINSDTFEVTDSYQMIDENIVVTNSIIGATNYDIGHLFFQVNAAKDSNGLANTPAVCLDNYKAGGVTGTIIPIGDAFDIDFTAHEIGHQLGAHHTHNNNCNRTYATSVEPGSGSTIMAYTGICPPNIQKNSNDYFHTKSIEEINSTLNSISCGQIISTTNTAPVITSNLNSGYTIPTSTAFALETTATDKENDQITYNWEQMNNEVSETSISKLPPISSNLQGPNFRSFPPQKVGIRYFPRLEKIISNQIVFETNPYLSSPTQYDQNNWEVIPSAARSMKFSVTVRDNNTQTGQTARQDVNVNFVNTGAAFSVTSQSINEFWKQNNPATIKWNVAGTTANGIDTPNVKILLSTNGGLTFDKVLAESVPNNGSYTFSVPAGLGTTSQARIMIKAIGNVFLAVNSANFSIESSLGTVEETQKEVFTISPNPSKGIITLDFADQTNNAQLKVVDMVGRAVFTSKLNASKSQQINLSHLTNGVYIISIETKEQTFTKKLIIKK